MAPLVSDNIIANVAYAAGFRAKDVVISVAVALAESAGNPYAVNVNPNHSVDHGLWQINTINPDALAIGDWRDPGINARMAMIVWKRQGWQGWATFNNGDYQQFMYRGNAAAVSLISNTHVLDRMLGITDPYETGNDVIAVQRLVGAIPVDGIFGPITEGYVKAWQKRHALTVDGVFGPECCVIAGWKWNG